jgi:GH25 family lysozyme M1 (1,4-beta-N-acetylmuramidase)
VKDIDIAVLTHPHWDHYNGLLQIESDGRFHIKLLYMYDPLTLQHGCDGSANGRAVKEDMDNAYKFIRKMQAYGTRVLWIDKGATIGFGDIHWKVFREQPASFTEEDDGNAYAFVNNGSLCLYSPEIEMILPGDGPDDQERMMDYFGGEVSGTDVTHHLNSWSMHNAKALKRRKCVVAFGSCVEKDGPGTSGWTKYGGGRIKEQGIPVWGQEADIYIHAANGLITFRQGNKAISKKIAYQGKESARVGRWVNDNGWKYLNPDGSWAHGWALLPWSKGKSWFYFDANGYCVYGWKNLKWSKGTNWFYFDPKNAAMRTGWIYDNGYWYYLDPKTGAMRTGWITYNGKRCYLEPVSGRNQGHCYTGTTATIDGKTYRFDKDGYAEELHSSADTVGLGMRVIDVSEFQPEDIDWGKVKAGGYAAVLRIGLRGSVPGTERYRKVGYDHHFKKYIDGVVRSGIPYSVYFFPTPMSDAEADQEADWIIMNVAGLKLSMPLWLDSERVPGGVANDISTADRTRYLKRITDKLISAGIPCGIYASTSWLNNQINMSAFPQQVRDNTWCAQYASSCTYGGAYAMWQYSSKANVDGINGNVDISEVKRSFNMSCQKTETKTEDGLDKDNVRIFPTTDPVKISNSGSDEHGNYKGGAAGDNTGREWYIRDWYNRPWNCVLRHPDPAVRACIADLATKAANNNRIGYDQYQRDTYWKELQKVGYDPSKITVACEADCSAGVIANIKAAGHLLGHKELQDITCTYTGNMRSGLKAAGFACLTDSKYINGSSYLVAGDILLNDAHHTATAVTNGINSGNGSVTPASMPLIKKGSKGSAVLQLQKLLNKLGYKLEEDGSFGPATDAAVKAYQKAHGLEVDGEVGPKTWGALLK